MQFGLTETQTTLKNTVRKFLAAECPPAEVRRLIETETAFDAALWKKMAEQGWTGIIFPEEHGGFGMGMVELAAAMEEMGRALLPGPYFSTVLLAGTLLDGCPDGGAKRAYLAAVCTGEKKGTLAMLEASADWSPEAVRMEAAPCDGGYRLNGQKLFVTDAGAADFLLCVARVDEALAIFAVDAGAPGLRVSAMQALDGTRKLYTVSFDDVVVGALALAASGDAASMALERMLNRAAAALSAEMVGGMQRALELTVEYAKTRKQFGKPIGGFQAVQHLCADMLLLTESSRSAAYYAAWAVQENVPEASEAVSIAKAYASDAYREVCNRGIQVHGGMGFTWENDLHLFYRRAKASEIAFGDANLHRERIAKLVVDAARRGA